MKSVGFVLSGIIIASMAVGMVNADALYGGASRGRPHGLGCAINELLAEAVRSNKGKG